MLKQKKKGIGLQNMISRTKSARQFDVSSIMGRKYSCGYNLTEQNKYQYKMTVELDSLTRLKNKILIVDHPLLFKDIKTPPRYQPDKYEFYNGSQGL
jgi:hypothetical protein